MGGLLMVASRTVVPPICRTEQYRSTSDRDIKHGQRPCSCLCRWESELVQICGKNEIFCDRGGEIPSPLSTTLSASSAAMPTSVSTTPAAPITLGASRAMSGSPTPRLKPG